MYGRGAAVAGLVAYSGGSVIASYWSGASTGCQYCTGTVDVTGLTAAQTKQSASFTGFSTIDTVGGAGTVWRQYNGSTAPLLAAFLTPAALSVNAGSLVYNGALQVRTAALDSGIRELLRASGGLKVSGF